MTRLSLILIVAAFVGLLCLAIVNSRNHSADKTLSAASTSGGDAQAEDEGEYSFPLPGNWPVADIKVPQECSAAKRPYGVNPTYGDEYSVRGSPFNVGDEHSGHMWSVGFECSNMLSSADVREHFNTQAEKLEWIEYYDSEDKRGKTREYISPDGRFITQLFAKDDSDHYMLTIFVYEEGWNPADVDNV